MWGSRQRAHDRRVGWMEVRCHSNRVILARENVGREWKMTEGRAEIRYRSEWGKEGGQRRRTQRIVQVEFRFKGHATGRATRASRVSSARFARRNALR